MMKIIRYRYFVHLWRILFLSVLLVVFILPLMWTGAASLNVQPDDSQTPPIWSWPPSLQNYFEVHAMQTYFWQELFTSIFISALVMALACTISFFAAYALAN